SGELCVHPGRRRQGLGRRLLDAVLDDVPTVALWAHGNLPGAQALARSAGLRVTRELWQMALDLTGPGEGPHPHSRREQDSSRGEILLSAGGEGGLHASARGGAEVRTSAVGQ